MAEVDVAPVQMSSGDIQAHKRKRSQSEVEPVPNGIHGSERPKDIQSIIRDIWEILKSHDNTSILARLSSSLPSSSNEDKQSAKRQKLSETSTPQTIEDKIQSSFYSDIAEFRADVQAAASTLNSSLTDSQKSSNGIPTWSYSVTQEEQESGQLSARVRSLERLALRLIASETGSKRHAGSVASGVKAEEGKPEALDAALSSQDGGRSVLTLFGNAQGHKQLFSSFQRPLKKIQQPDLDASFSPDDEAVLTLRETGLPNNMFSTRILPVSAESVSSSSKGQTFGDIFAPPPNVAQLQPPKSRNGQARGDTLSWARDKAVHEPKRVGYTFEKLPAAQWLGYGGVVHIQESSSPEAKRKRRDRALSTGEAVLTPSEGAKAAQLQAKEEALFRSAYSSFAPSIDNSGALVPEEDKSQIWWERHGREYFEQLFSYPEAGVDDQPSAILEEPSSQDNETEFARAVEEYEPLSCEPWLSKAPMAEERETHEMLAEISEMLETLHSHQRIRNTSLSGNPKSSISPSPSLNDLTGTPSTPSTAEVLLHDTLKQQLALMISFLPPYAVAKLNGNQLDELNISRHLPIQDVDYRGVMDEDQGSRLARQAALQAAVGAANANTRPMSTPGPYGVRQTPPNASQPRMAQNGYTNYQSGAMSRASNYARQPLSNWQPHSQGYHQQRPSYGQMGASPAANSPAAAIQANRNRSSFGGYAAGRPQVNGYGQHPSINYQSRQQSQSLSSAASGFGLGSPVARHGSPQGYQVPTPQMTRPGSSSHSQYGGNQSPPQQRPGSSYMNQGSPTKAAPKGYLTPTASSNNSIATGFNPPGNHTLNGSRPQSPVGPENLAKREGSAPKTSAGSTPIV